MSTIITKAKTILQKAGFNPINSPNNEEVFFLPSLNGKNGGQFNITFVGRDASNDIDAILLVITEFPIKVPPNKRDKMLNFLNMLNSDAWYTWLSLDMKNGGIVCKSSGRSKSTASLNEDILEILLFSTISRLDALQPFIMDIIYSEKSLETLIKEMNPSAK